MLVPLAFAAQAPVRLERRVATVEAVVAELAAKSGQELRMRPELKDEVLYVDLKPRPSADLMRLVARAASAEWFREDGHTYLGRSPSFWRRQAKADAAATARAYAERLAPLLAPGDATPWGEDARSVDKAAAFVDANRRLSDDAIDDATRSARMRAYEPAGRLLSRLLRALPPAEVAALPPGWDGRYALPATGRQTVLPGAVAASVRQYVEERRAFMAEYGSASPEARDKVRGYLMLFSLDAPTPDAPKVRLTANRSLGSVSFTMTVRDPARREIDQEFATVPALSLAEETAARALPGYAAWKAKRMPLGEAPLAFGRALAFPPSSALAAPMRDPAAHEPLAALTDPMDALAAATGDDAIVALPDGAAMLTWAFADGRDGLGGFADGLASLCALRMEEGVLVGPALRPTDAALTKTRRAPLGVLFRLAARSEPRLADVARYAAAQNPESGETGFEAAVWYAAGFGSHLPPGLFDSSGRSPVRLFGDLAPPQRQTLLAGGSVAAGDLSPAARADLEHWVFSRGLAVDAPDGGTTGGEIAEAIAELGPGMRLTGMPGLVSPFAASPGKDGVLRFTDARMLGHFLKIEEEGVDPSPWPDVRRDRFRPAVRSEFSLAFLAGPGRQGHAELVDLDLDPDARPVPYGELPEPHRAAMAKGYGKALP